MSRRGLGLVVCGGALALGIVPGTTEVAFGQVKTNVPDVVPGAKPATVERITIHGTSLEGNLEGDAVDRAVLVFLPPGYVRERTRRYPAPQTIEGAFAKGAREMIVVLPDSKTVHNGSMYSSSVTTGDFERFIMSPCCLSARGAGPPNQSNDEALAAVKAPADSAKLSSGLRAQLASAAAWSPDPNNPPLYLDLPIGPNQQAVLARWAANAPLAFVDQYIQNLRRYRGIAIDVGDKDGLRVDAGKLHDVLISYAIKHDFEIYAGTHTSDVAIRFQEHVVPFFSRTLSFEQRAR